MFVCAACRSSQVQNKPLNFADKSKKLMQKCFRMLPCAMLAYNKHKHSANASTRDTCIGKKGSCLSKPENQATHRRPGMFYPLACCSNTISAPAHHQEVTPATTGGPSQSNTTCFDHQTTASLQNNQACPKPIAVVHHMRPAQAIGSMSTCKQYLSWRGRK